MAKKYKHVSGIEVSSMDVPVLGSFPQKYKTLYRTDKGEFLPSWILQGKDWEEVVVMDWEVLAYKDPEVISDIPNAHLLNKWSYRWPIACVRGFPIHSVGRLSDGEVFSIDDITNKGRIDGFKIYGNTMEATFEGGTRGALLNDLQKVKKALFTTEDGVAVTDELQNVYSVCIKGGWDTVQKFCYKHNGGYKNGTMFREGSPWKHFSTIEKRDEYLLNNKPCLSLNDLNPLTKPSVHFGGVHPDWLINLVKSKLAIP